MFFSLSKNINIVTLFLVLIILLIIFIYLDKNSENNKNKESLENKNNNITFELNTKNLNKVINIKSSTFLSYTDGTFNDVSNQIDSKYIKPNNDIEEIDSNNEKMKRLNNKLSDYNKIYALPGDDLSETFKNGMYEFTIVGKYKDGTNVQYPYSIIVYKNDFHKPYFKDQEGYNHRRPAGHPDRMGEQVAGHRYWFHFHHATGWALSGDSDRAYFVPKKKTPLQIEVWIKQDIDASNLDIKLVWKNNNKEITPIEITNKSNLRAEYGNTNAMLSAGTHNTVLLFEVEEHIRSPGTFNIIGNKDGKDILIDNHYDNLIDVKSLNTSNPEIIDSNIIKIDSEYNNRKNTSLVYKFNDSLDILNIGIMIFEFELSHENISIKNFLRDILNYIYFGNNKKIDKNNFTYNINIGDDAVYLLFIRSDLYSNDDVLNWINDYIGKSYYPPEQYLICGYQYDDGILSTIATSDFDNSDNSKNIKYISLGCFNDYNPNSHRFYNSSTNVRALPYKLDPVNSVDECYIKANSKNYKYFGLKTNMPYEVVFYQHFSRGGANYKYVIGEYSDVTPGTWDNAATKPGYHGEMDGTKIGYSHTKHRGAGYTNQHGGLKSMQVPKELKVTLYSEKNFGGNNITIEGPIFIDRFVARGTQPAIFDYTISSMKVELKDGQVDAAYQCWGGNNWQSEPSGNTYKGNDVSKYGTTSCDKEGDQHKIYMYSIGNNLPDDYTSDSVTKCANYNERCDCNGDVIMGPRYRKGNMDVSGERSFFTTHPNRVIESDGHVYCNEAYFGSWGNGYNMKHTKNLHCWCMNTN